MSYDPPAAQKEFRENQGFPFRLIPDTTHEMSEAWGTARPPDHQYKDWPRRVTYLVGPDATVVEVWEVKDVAGHATAVLDRLLAEAGSSS